MIKLQLEVTYSDGEGETRDLGVQGLDDAIGMLIDDTGDGIDKITIRYICSETIILEDTIKYSDVERIWSNR